MSTHSGLAFVYGANIMLIMPDAVPKKRGPKTDVLEALLKRVDGLEQKLKEKKGSGEDDDGSEMVTDDSSSQTAEKSIGKPRPSASAVESDRASTEGTQMPSYSPSALSQPSPPEVRTDTLLDTYFARFHAKPYHILDESSVRQRLQLGQVPPYMMHAIYAVAAR
jgi:hypothetical protein